MGLLSASVSITRYKVAGDLEKPVIETVAKALKENAISEIDDHASQMTAGWSSFRNPYHPNFDGSSFAYGPYLLFSLRIDKKSIPAKIIQKHYNIELAKKLAASGREYFSRNEKQMIKDHVTNILSLRIPATPNVYDVLWNYEGASVWFFSNLKSANEEFESLFFKSFKVSVIRLFPYTAGQLDAGLSPSELDEFAKLTPSNFTG
jgi:recombination associated protein RdgC